MIKVSHMSIIIIQFACFAFISTTLNSTGFIRNPDHDNLIFTKYLIKEVSNITNARRCAGLCGHHANCSSVFYNSVDKSCRLHATENFFNAHRISSPGWKMFVVEDKDCPVHLSFIHDKSEWLCLHVTTKRYSFSEGKQYCNDRNATMLSLKSVQKQQAFARFIVKIVPDPVSMFEKNIHLGLHKTNGSWLWEDGEVLGTSLNWGSSQPYCPEGLDCDCAAIILKWSGYTWNDDGCQWKRTIICEYING